MSFDYDDETLPRPTYDNHKLLPVYPGPYTQSGTQRIEQRSTAIARPVTANMADHWSPPFYEGNESRVECYSEQRDVHVLRRSGQCQSYVERHHRQTEGWVCQAFPKYTLCEARRGLDNSGRERGTLTGSDRSGRPGDPARDGLTPQRPSGYCVGKAFPGTVVWSMVDTPRTRWYRPSPSWLLIGLLFAEAILWLSDRLGWPRWHKGYAVLVTVTGVGGFVLLVLLWFLWSPSRSLAVSVLDPVALCPDGCRWRSVQLVGSREEERQRAKGNRRRDQNVGGRAVV